MSFNNDFLQKIATEQNYQFWAFNIFGWSGYGFFISLGAIMWGKDLPVQLSYGALATLTGFGLSLLMRYLYQRFWDFNPLSRFLWSLAVVIVITAVWSYFKMESFFWMMEFIGNPGSEEKQSNRGFGEYLSWYTYSFFIILSWASMYYGIKYAKMLQREKQRRLAATAMAHEAQLKMLRYQLNPHFLFNTLNAISTLILLENNKVANTMVIELSKFLRYSLENHPMQKVDLMHEIATLKLYLNIEKVRFEERLQLSIELDEKSKSALIPSLLLQPLVENSIKYAISKNENGGGISIKAKVFAGKLLIEVLDDGPGIDITQNQLPDFSGVGLRNFRERLRELYGDNHHCTFENAEPHGLKISICLPYETNREEI